MNLVKEYYRLTKPGIIYGNAISTLAGFFFASKWVFNPWLLVAVMAGSSLVIGGSCAFNNYFDRNLDSKMARTKKRPLVTGTISKNNALIFAALLTLLGFVILYYFVNLTTVVVGLVGCIDYVLFYTFSKPKTTQATLIGSISGATPIVAGYTAVTNRIDIASVILFLILVAWQMPHFYAIAMYRLNDYKEASVPVLPLVKGMEKTKNSIIFYIFTFIIAGIALYLFGYTKVSYLVVTLLLGAVWLGKALLSKGSSDGQWARQIFLFSLIILVVFSVLISVQTFLP